MHGCEGEMWFLISTNLPFLTAWKLRLDETNSNPIRYWILNLQSPCMHHVVRAWGSHQCSKISRERERVEMKNRQSSAACCTKEARWRGWKCLSDTTRGDLFKRKIVMKDDNRCQLFLKQRDICYGNVRWPMGSTKTPTVSHSFPFLLPLFPLAA